MAENQDNLNNMLRGLSPESIRRNQEIFIDVVAKYYGDPDFQAKVDADADGVLRAEGLDLPEGAKVKLLFNTDKLIHVVLPSPVTRE